MITIITLSSITGEGSEVNDPSITLEQVLGNNVEVEELFGVVVFNGDYGLRRRDSRSTNRVEDGSASGIRRQSVAN